MMSFFSDEYNAWTEEDLKALQTIGKMEARKERLTRKAVLIVPLVLLGFFVPFIVVFCTDIHPLWGMCFVLPVIWCVVFPVMVSLESADRRIKRCEDYLLSKIVVKHEKADINVFMMKNHRLIKCFGIAILHSCAFIMVRYYPFNQGGRIPLTNILIALIFICFIIFIFVLGKLNAVIWITVSCTLVDMIAGSAPWPFLLLSFFGMIVFAGSFFAERLIPKALKKRFDQDAESRIKPMLKTIMTVERFNSGERLPYVDFGGGEQYEGNCCTHGKWNGTDIAFSNISFKTDVKIKEDPNKPMDMPYAKKMLEGICVFYTADREPTEKMLEIIRDNLRQYRCYDALILPNHQISVTLKNGYYFVEGRNIDAVCCDAQLECDAVKLNGVFEAIKAGVEHRKLEPRFETLTEVEEEL